MSKLDEELDSLDVDNDAADSEKKDETSVQEEKVDQEKEEELDKRDELRELADNGEKDEDEVVEKAGSVVQSSESDVDAAKEQDSDDKGEEKAEKTDDKPAVKEEDAAEKKPVSSVRERVDKVSRGEMRFRTLTARSKSLEEENRSLRASVSAFSEGKRLQEKPAPQPLYDAEGNAIPRPEDQPLTMNTYMEMQQRDREERRREEVAKNIMFSHPLASSDPHFADNLYSIVQQFPALSHSLPQDLAALCTLGIYCLRLYDTPEEAAEDATGSAGGKLGTTSATNETKVASQSAPAGSVSKKALMAARARGSQPEKETFNRSMTSRDWRKSRESFVSGLREKVEDPD